MDKITTVSLEEQLISHWLKGWPDYVVYPSDDYPSIRQLVTKIGDYLKVEPSEVSGHDRVCNALKTIATYCRSHLPYAAKNLHYVNRAFQTLHHEMTVAKRISNFRNKNNNYDFKK